MLDGEKAELKEDVILLNEIGIKNKNLERRVLKQRIYEAQRQIDEITDLLERDVLKEQTLFKIKKMKEMVVKGEDSEGNELCDADKIAVEIKIKYLKKDVKEQFAEEKLRLKIIELQGMVEENEKNLKIVEKQIRERKIVNKHR